MDASYPQTIKRGKKFQFWLLSPWMTHNKIKCLRPKICCFFESLVINYFSMCAIHSADKCSKKQQIWELDNTSFKPQDMLLIWNFVCRMKGSKHKLVDGQIFEQAANLWSYTGGHTPAGQRSLSGSMSNLSVAGGHGRNWGSNSDFRWFERKLHVVDLPRGKAHVYNHVVLLINRSRKNTCL